MSALLWANNISSLFLVIGCWWLAHQYATYKPPGRAISIALGAFGLNTLFIMFARNFEVPVGWPVVASKILLGIGMALIVVRHLKRGQA